MVQIEDKGYEDLKEQVLKFIDETYPDKNFTFKVDTRRANKQYPHTSDQINRDLGEIILETYPETKVDVHHPDVLLHVEIRGKNINLYSLVIPGRAECRWERTARLCCFCRAESTARWPDI